MDSIFILLILCCCYCFCILIGGGGYYYITQKNLVKPEETKMSNPAIDNISSITTTSSPTTTITTTTPLLKGLTIYSDLNFQGKSLFLPIGTYDKLFFDKNWPNLGIRSWKSTNTDKLMITFQGTGNGGFGGGSVNVNANNIGIIFSNNDFIMKEITEFNIYTPEQYKKNFCLTQNSGTIYNSHWGDPPSACDDYSDVTKYTSLTGKWGTPGNSLGPINITMNSLGNKGTLRFDNSSTDYSFNLIDLDNKIWQSSGFAMNLKLIDDNKLRPVKNPWNYTDEQLTYIKQ